MEKIIQNSLALNSVMDAFPILILWNCMDAFYENFMKLQQFFHIQTKISDMGK